MIIAMHTPTHADGSIAGPYEITVDGVLVAITYSRKSASRLYDLCLADEQYAAYLRDQYEILRGRSA